MSKSEAPAKKYVKISLKLAFVAGLLYFLMRKGFISIQDTRRAFSDWQNMVPAISVLLFNVFLGALRWQWLLRAQGIHLRMRRVLELTFIGNFFNIALPGAVSGDFVKAFYVGREVEGKRARAFGAILFDRVAGLSALSVLAAGAAVFGHDHLARSMLATLKPALIIGAACVVAFYAYLFLVREKHDPVLLLLKALEIRAPKVGALTRVYEGLRHYHNHRWTVIQVLLSSLLIHMTVGWACLKFAYALGVTQIHILPVYVIVPIGMLVTAVPVAPAGVGTGHAAFLALFKLIGSDRGADIFTIFALTNIFFGMIGGLVYLRFRGHEPKPALEPTEAEKVSLA